MGGRNSICMAQFANTVLPSRLVKCLAHDACMGMLASAQLMDCYIRYGSP
jgi:hypothetical protein